MTEKPDQSTRRYEIRLLTIERTVRLFALAAATDGEAADYAKRLLLRHSDCESAEVWCGMKLIRQL